VLINQESISEFNFGRFSYEIIYQSHNVDQYSLTFDLCLFYGNEEYGSKTFTIYFTRNTNDDYNTAKNEFLSHEFTFDVSAID
jgi:hypothetical protein